MKTFNVIKKNGESREFDIQTDVIKLEESFVKYDISKYDSVMFLAKENIQQTIFDVSSIKDYFVFGFGRNKKMNMKNILTGGDYFLLGMHQPYILFIKNKYVNINERIINFS
jgi:hypothetical protein